MKTSLIVTTYNSLLFLEKVLESILRQNYPLHEIVLAEDAQFLSNAQLLSKFRQKTDTPIQHIFHDDIGNRKPLIMNKAVAATKGDYLIFIDGDCMLRKDFVAAHVEFADEGAFLTGRRVDLSAAMSDFITPQMVREGYLDHLPLRLYWDAIAGDTRSLGRMFKTPKTLRQILGQNHVNDIRGCNFSVHRKNLLAINGFANYFSGAYGEDSDAEYRLKFLGLCMKSVKGAAIQFHLNHKEQSKDPKNQVLLQEVLAKKTARTHDGLEQLKGG